MDGLFVIEVPLDERTRVLENPSTFIPWYTTRFVPRQQDRSLLTNVANRSGWKHGCHRRCWAARRCPHLSPDTRTHRPLEDPHREHLVFFTVTVPLNGNGVRTPLLFRLDRLESSAVRPQRLPDAVLPTIEFTWPSRAMCPDSLSRPMCRDRLSDGLSLACPGRTSVVLISRESPCAR